MKRGWRGRCKRRKSGSDESVRWPLINQTLRQSKINSESYIFGSCDVVIWKLRVECYSRPKYMSHHQTSNHCTKAPSPLFFFSPPLRSIRYLPLASTTLYSRSPQQYWPFEDICSSSHRTLCCNFSHRGRILHTSFVRLLFPSRVFWPRDLPPPVFVRGCCGF